VTSDVPFGRRADDLHRVGRSDLGEVLLADVISSERSGEVVEVGNHRRREVEVQLPTGNIPDTKPMSSTLRNEDERAGGAHELAVLEIHEVLAVEHVERLCTVMVHVDRGAEAGWLFGLQHGDDARCLGRARFHRDTEIAQVDQPPLARAKHVGPCIASHDAEAATTPEGRQEGTRPERVAPRLGESFRDDA
jgi:hypothetical protein